MEQLKQYYTNIYSVAYSSCGHYLVAGNTYGDIAIFNLSPYLEKDDSEQFEELHKYPYYKFKAHDAPIYSIVSNKQLIISGGVAELKVWKWSDVKKKNAKSCWSFTIPQGDSLVKPEINAMVLSKKDDNGLLYVGCGNSKLYCLDVEKQTLLFVLEGHTDSINCIDLGNSGQECVSGSEDGSMRLWDARKGGNAIHVLEPYKHNLVNRPEQGKWIGCVGFDSSDDWLVCGGAPTLGVWHIRSLAPSTRLEKPGILSYVALFHEDTIISGGSEPFINHWSLDGKLNIEVPSSSSNIFTIGVNSSPTQQILASAGSNYKIDLCTDFRYKDVALYFCNNSE
ncbi:THO complex subunit 6 homolog [Parasteatoda tepidariorum]|uniref:THO complex subunit 6 homolog n=1 Tax=Parasteatoda tepidariorum TaxID=114398 RepID=UPI00077FA634|nr:THO complex subunit 6 homolog [Parasteatoda tepidariorum]XP_042898942.1 THO complex subunit 6 homolog [Parasteatoda tepidariorum]